tara:strand:+ start:2277 stop:2462 length:186 start_codon:yes stop_codon:yes gene_type:complete
LKKLIDIALDLFKLFFKNIWKIISAILGLIVLYVILVFLKPLIYFVNFVDDVVKFFENFFF